MSEERHSDAESPTLITDDIARAEREAANALAQFDRVLDLVDDVVRGGRPFRLRVSMIQELHRIALDGLSAYAGNWRPGDVRIHGSGHMPPKAHLVPALMEDLCDWINDRTGIASPITLCAYVMWRLNWIHPFDDGNGRTSRAVAYFVLCAAAGYRLQGRVTIPELIAANKSPYYRALEQVDANARLQAEPDLTPMKELLEGYLAKQLAEAFEAANAASPPRDDNDRRFH
ncbi:MAG: Fic family protein [Sphingomonas sp.]|nr:Fic family protein [Sphingomonas sp.]